VQLQCKFVVLFVVHSKCFVALDKANLHLQVHYESRLHFSYNKNYEAVIAV